MLKMDLEYESCILFVRYKGALTRKNTYKITNYIIPIIRKYPIKYVIFNMSKISKMDEQGIDSLLSVKCTLKNHHGKIYLCEVEKALKLSLKRLHIKVLSSEETALKLCEV